MCYLSLFIEHLDTIGKIKFSVLKLFLIIYVKVFDQGPNSLNGLFLPLRPYLQATLFIRPVFNNPWYMVGMCCEQFGEKV